MFEPLLGFTNTNCTGRTHKQTIFAWKTPVRQCKGNNKKSWCFWTLCLSQLIDAQPRGGNRQTEKRFCKLGQLSCLFWTFSKRLSVEEPPPAMLGAASVLRGRRGTQPSWAHTTHAFTTALYWKMAQTLGVFANMLRICYRLSAQSTNVSI